MSMQILGEQATEERAQSARLSSFVGALALGDLVKSTLGPKGFHKILQSPSTGDISVTNDGATILKSIQLDNPAAKILVNISKVQDDEIGDGTTSVCVLAAELLRQAEILIAKKIHPQTIIHGFRRASQAALEALEQSALNSKNAEGLRVDLLNIAKTTIGSKVLSADKDYFAEMVVEAVLRLKGSTSLSHIQIIKKPGGRLTDSYLDKEGFIMDKVISVHSPKRLENARILIANTSMDTDKIKVFGARLKVSSPAELAQLERAERAKMAAKITQIASTQCNTFVNRQLIYNYPESLLSSHNILSIEHLDFEGVERLALVTGGEIVSSFSDAEDGGKGIAGVKLGLCDLIEEVIIGEDKLVRFSGFPSISESSTAPRACTIVLRGSTNSLLDEAERSLHDALAVLSQVAATDSRTVLGGGCSEMLMSCRVEDVARSIAVAPGSDREEGSGKVGLAIQAFADALKQIPTILADNAGMDSGELVSRLRAKHFEFAANVKGTETCDLGLNLTSEGQGLESMRTLGVTESYKLKKQVVISAGEAAEMILRVDNILRAAPRKREAV